MNEMIRTRKTNIVEKKGKLRPVNFYEHKISSDTFTHSPRTEVILSTITFVSCIAFTVVILQRWGSDIEAAYGYALIVFFISFAYHLRSVTGGAFFIVEECLVELLSKLGILININSKLQTRAFAIFTFAATIAVAAAPYFIITETFDVYFPHPALRRAPYTGGG